MAFVATHVSGKVLRTFSGLKGDAEVKQIDLSRLPAGTYIMHVKTGAQQYVEKVVVH